MFAFAKFPDAHRWHIVTWRGDGGYTSTCHHLGWLSIVQIDWSRHYPSDAEPWWEATLDPGDRPVMLTHPWHMADDALVCKQCMAKLRAKVAEVEAIAGGGATS